MLIINCIQYALYDSKGSNMTQAKQFISYLEEWLIAAILAYLAIITPIQVFMRHVVGQSLSWSEESVRFAFIWMIMLGFSAGVRRDTHIRVLLVFDCLKGKARYVVQMLVHILFFITAAAVFYLSILNVTSFIEFPQVSPALGVPMQYVYLAAPVGFGLTMIRLIQRMILDTRSFRHAPHSPTEK